MGSRRAQLDDTEAIASLLSELHTNEVTSSQLTPDLATIIDDTSRAVMLVIDDAGKPCGMAVLNLVYKLPKIECRVDEVIVSNTVRGQGYGTELMNACEHWAWQQQADVIEFTSRPSREAANHLYQKLGYELRATNVYTKKRSKS